MSTKAFAISLLTSLSMLTAGCGDVHQGPSPSLVNIVSLTGAGGKSPVISDVITIVKVNSVDVPTIFNDVGEVSMQVLQKDIAASPSPLNTVTFTRYRVEFQRTDGHNIQGVDVPYSFDSALTISVGPSGAKGSFELVRNSAKQEAPLRALVTSGTFVSTIANVTFYGKDQAGNNVAVTGSLAVDFGNFADPTTS